MFLRASAATVEQRLVLRCGCTRPSPRELSADRSCFPARPPRAGSDYTISGTNFTLDAATTSATFTVTLHDDDLEESAETVVLTLVHVTGGILEAPSVFTLTIAASDLTGGNLLISQYTETDSGTIPKGLEIWNASSSDLTFDSGSNLMDIKVGVNGGTPASVLTVSSGTLVAGDVWVIGTSDLAPDIEKTFTFNGNDALVIELGGVVQDVIGTPGVDPGSAWTGNGVSTANQNIQLLSGITFGDPDGWTDPSERFEYVAAGSVSTGFGEPPAAADPRPRSPAHRGAIRHRRATLEFNVVATPTDGDLVTLAASNLPAGATFAATNENGVFRWASSGPAGSYSVTFTAADKDGADEEIVAITVDPEGGGEPLTWADIR